MIGWGLLIWLKRQDRELLRRVLAAAAPGLAATVLLLWQTRTGPAAQMFATVGAAALLYYGAPRLWNATSGMVRVFGMVAFVLIAAGAAVPFAFNLIPAEKTTERQQAISKANRLCNTLWGLRPVALQSKGMVFTFIDQGPRLIAVTHHDAVGGPYHRNGQQIADVMPRRGRAWRGPSAS